MKNWNNSERTCLGSKAREESRALKDHQAHPVGTHQQIGNTSWTRLRYVSLVQKSLLTPMTVVVITKLDKMVETIIRRNLRRFHYIARQQPHRRPSTTENLNFQWDLRLGHLGSFGVQSISNSNQTVPWLRTTTSCTYRSFTMRTKPWQRVIYCKEIYKLAFWLWHRMKYCELMHLTLNTFFPLEHKTEWKQLWINNQSLSSSMATQQADNMGWNSK